MIIYINAILCHMICIFASHQHFGEAVTLAIGRSLAIGRLAIDRSLAIGRLAIDRSLAIGRSLAMAEIPVRPAAARTESGSPRTCKLDHASPYHRIMHLYIT